MAEATADAARVLREPAPSVPRLPDRHPAAAPDWLPHPYVPWCPAQDFDGPPHGTAWAPEQSAPPRAARNAPVVDLLTEDALPSHHLEIASRFGRDGTRGTWVHRRTAAEDRHASALRSCVHARRAVDPVTLEELRKRHVATGHRTGPPALLHPPAHVTAQATTQEPATRQAHRNAGAACADPEGGQLTARIAPDENPHMLFRRALVADTLVLSPRRGPDRPGGRLDAWRCPARRSPASGCVRRASRRPASPTSTSASSTRVPPLRALKVTSLPGPGPAGGRARNRLAAHLDGLAVRATRARESSERMNAGRTPTAGAGTGGTDMTHAAHVRETQP
ncbi:acyl-ACP desaturase [Streptomyces sediminimaris]|uniref:acyl-ACP desaturase n=1 Tax=Streptomyces sediminimaris TaxID=3383721 RepID=UPI003999F405